jgi:FtsH-binding integral membrane protein
MPKLSSVVLLAIAAIAVIVIAAIFGYILFFSGQPLTSQLWWMGFSGLIFALVFYFVYAATNDRRISRPLAGAFFVIGVGSYYGSLFTNGDTSIGKLLWMVLLSILVVIVLATIFWMSRQTERDAIRKNQRRLTP